MNEKQIDEVMIEVEAHTRTRYSSAEDSDSGLAAIRAKLVELAGWQPIDTAPKDVCTEFDGWNGERVTDVSWGWPEYHPKEKRCWIRAVYETGYGWITEEVHGLTHWIKKPEAPQ